MEAVACAVLFLGCLTHAHSLDFTGKYESTDLKENTAQFTAQAREDEATDGGKIVNEFTCKEYHHKFAVPSQGYVQDLPFQLGEERQGTYNGKTFKYLYTMEDNKLKASFTMPDGKLVEQVYDFNPEGFTKTYKSNDTAARVAFKKIEL